jgi:hypothetical protein
MTQNIEINNGFGNKQFDLADSSSPRMNPDNTIISPRSISSVTSSSIAINGFVGPQTQGYVKPSEDRSVPSPYSLAHSLIQTLTLPSHPRVDIPPSPPGTVSMEINKKFEHFSLLKKQKVHFNEKLARSCALKNPGLLQKLMEFADIGEKDDYDTTLPKDIWSPPDFQGFRFGKHDGK